MNNDPMSTAKKVTPLQVVKVSRSLTPAVCKDRDLEEQQLSQLILKITTELVNDPSDVSISVQRGERTTVFKIECSKNSIGQIIGSSGKHIQSLRVIAQGISARKGFRCIIEIPYYDPKQYNNNNPDQ